ncbi:ABC transporter b family member 9 [Phtheirospermum japonicum]|uniref:ABC transporter b family member 9 n=1 Tax=Phtheirospermum japonicum TaxID=374723 RepID=A0A830D5K6_9LAMI|nr:ABC transporter b family member 9 [Phtheirospermum japonicum]
MIARKRGAIVNIGSGTALLSLLIRFIPTKAYVDQFSRCLYVEYKNSGINVQCQIMYEEASQVANDAVSSIRTVASFSAEDKVMKMYEQKCVCPLKSGVRLGIISGSSFGVGNFLLFCTQAFCFYIGVVLIQHGKASFV